MAETETPPETSAAQAAAAALSGQPTAPEKPEPKGDPPTENLIGEAQRKEDLDKALKAAKAAQKEAEGLRSQLEKIEGEKLSDLEKATKRAEAAEQRANTADAKAVSLERSGWVTTAAQKAGFADPGDAVAFLDLADFEDEDKVKEAVAELATTKPHLLKAEGKPTPFGSLTGEPTPEVPVGADGKPDHKGGMAQELAQHLLGRRG